MREKHPAIGFDTSLGRLPSYVLSRLETFANPYDVPSDNRNKSVARGERTARGRTYRMFAVCLCGPIFQIGAQIRLVSRDAALTRYLHSRTIVSYYIGVDARRIAFADVTFR